MPTHPAAGAPIQHTAIRILIANVESDLANLGSEDVAATARLRESWSALVKHLAIGPAPKLRECPQCHEKIMAAATRCMHCWWKSPPEIDEVPA